MSVLIFLLVDEIDIKYLFSIGIGFMITISSLLDNTPLFSYICIPVTI